MPKVSGHDWVRIPVFQLRKSEKRFRIESRVSWVYYPQWGEINDPYNKYETDDWIGFTLHGNSLVRTMLKGELKGWKPQEEQNVMMDKETDRHIKKLMNWYKIEKND